MLRVSTANAFETGVSTLQRRQRDLTDAQSKLTSGRRVERPSDDPAAAARAERAMLATRRADTDQRSLDASRSAMTQAEAALGDAGELLQQARETLVAAGNASYGSGERASLAQALKGMRDQLLGVANRTDGAGSYLFGGQGTDQTPFVEVPGGNVNYYATVGDQQTASTEPLPLTMDGRQAWLQANTGNGVFETRATTSTGTAWIDGGTVTNPSQYANTSYGVTFSVAGGVTSYTVADGGGNTVASGTYSSGVPIQVSGISFTIKGQPANGDRFDVVPSTPTLSVFKSLQDAINVLGNPSATASQVTQAATLAMRDMDSVQSNIAARRADAGAWLNRLDGVETRVSASKLQAQTDRSNAEDLDMVQAVSEFQQQQSGYDAALKAYATVQKLSLFQYLNG